MLVSIVIPTRNRPDNLRQLLKSISAQTFRDFEVLVVNDCSVNLSEYKYVVQKYQAKLPHFKYLVNSQQLGAPASRNRGIRAAQGTLLALVDDDDEWLPTKLNRQVEVFQKSDNRLGLVYTWTKVINKKSGHISLWRAEHEGDVRVRILRSCFIPSPSVMVSKKAIYDAGLFDPKLSSCQDWDMWTRIFFKKYTCRVVRSVEAIYHQQTSESVGTSNNALYGYLEFYKKHLNNAWRINKVTALYQLINYIKICIKLTVKKCLSFVD